MFEDALLQQLPEVLDPKAVAAGQVISQQLSTSEWLGPLAPVALSPFFGLATLSGIATYGPEWLQQKSALFHTGGPLNNPCLFWTMAVLAVFTSLPRLTKVSKPISLAAEKLEAYSAIIILISVRMMGGSEVPSTGNEHAIAEPQALAAVGVGSFSLNVMMSLFAAINVFVVNLVKLFFEFIIWLIPIPAVDAIAEISNKSLCAGLMALYCYSPWLATIVNLGLLVVCFLVFNWIYRRVNFYKQLISAPVLAWLFPKWFAQRGDSFTAFIESSGRGLSKYQPVAVTRQSGQYKVVGRKGFSRFSFTLTEDGKRTAESSSGWVSQRLVLSDEGRADCVLVFRKWVKADSLYSGATQADAAPVV
ncbi:MAG: hypothetical protein U0930_24720 [Pirellulales bacterium]